jgi:hypothetical protein
VVASPTALITANRERENEKRKGCRTSILRGYNLLGNEQIQSQKGNLSDVCYNSLARNGNACKC